MANDPNDTGRRRKVASSLLKAATPVSSTLDAFIARANEELVDLAAAPFKPEHREGVLRRELDEVSVKLAAAEARATAAEARATAADARATAADVRASESRGSTRWGLTIAAFLVGGAAMFALSFVLPGKEPPAPAAAPVATSPPVTPSAPPPPAVTVEPITEPATVAEPAAVAPPPAPVAVPEATEKVTTKKAAKPRRPVAREDSAATPKPPEDDLYNPF